MEDGGYCSFSVSSCFFLFHLVFPVSSSLFFKLNFRTLALFALALFISVSGCSGDLLVCTDLGTENGYKLQDCYCAVDLYCSSNAKTFA